MIDMHAVRHFVPRTFARFGLGVSQFTFPSKRAPLAQIFRTQIERGMLLTPMEAWMLISTVQSVSSVAGDIAEIGIYRGGSSSLLAEAAPGKLVFSFDTFEGLPSPHANDGSNVWQGRFASSEDEVRHFLSNWKNIRVHKGIFPRSLPEGFEERRFSFVHLDVDLYEGTLESLQWFYPRLSAGAVVISHDYNICPGVKRAFDEFAQTVPENVIELPTNQCMIVKMA